MMLGTISCSVAPVIVLVEPAPTHDVHGLRWVAPHGAWMLVILLPVQISALPAFVRVCRSEVAVAHLVKVMLCVATHVPGYTLAAAADQRSLPGTDVRELRRGVLNTALRVPHPRGRLVAAELLRVVELAAGSTCRIELHLDTVGEVTPRRDPFRVGPVARGMDRPCVDGD